MEVTALQQFIDFVLSRNINHASIINNKEYYLNLEKQQIILAHNKGYLDGHDYNGAEAEDYFNDIYKKINI